MNSRKVMAMYNVAMPQLLDATLIIDDKERAMRMQESFEQFLAVIYSMVIEDKD